MASQAEAIHLAKRTIVAYHLTDTPLRCLTIAPAPDFTGPGYELDVREAHVQGCGDALPLFDPLVMSIHVAPDGQLTTTAGEPDALNRYRQPACPAAKHPAAFKATASE